MVEGRSIAQRRAAPTDHPSQKLSRPQSPQATSLRERGNETESAISPEHEIVPKMHKLSQIPSPVDKSLHANRSPIPHRPLSIREVRQKDVVSETSMLPQGNGVQQRTPPVAKHRILSDDVTKQPPKPKWSTYQQQYTPQKASTRPASVSSDLSQNSSGNRDSFLDKANPMLQELMELQILYATSSQTLLNYEQSAMATLKEIFEEASSEESSVNAMRSAYASQQAQKSLLKWLSQDRSSSTPGRVGNLATAIQELNDLQGPTGLIQHVFDRYQSWFDSMILTLDTRAPDEKTRASKHELRLITALDAAWHRDTDVLSRKLENYLSIFSEPDPDDRDYGIGAILFTHRQLVQTILHSLQVCLSIERMILDQEQDWLSDTVRRTKASVQRKHSGAPAVPAWSPAD